GERHAGVCRSPHAPERQLRRRRRKRDDGEARPPACRGAPLPGRAPGRALPLRRVSHRRRRRARAVDPQRLWRVALLAALLAAGSVRADERAPSVRLLVQSSPLAGFRYHAAAEVWDQLRGGDALELRREPDNPHDPGAVSVAWHGCKLGYVPRRENAALAWGLDRGEPLRARISRLAPHPNPARRVEFEVYFESNRRHGTRGAERSPLGARDRALCRERESQIGRI